VLIHNAGVLPHERRETADGIELTFATNVLGPYLLTELLHERLRASASARVLFVTSGGIYTERHAVDDLQSRDGPFRASAVSSRTKRAELAICQEWAETLRGSGIVVHAMHPGWSDSPASAMRWRASRVRSGRSSGRPRRASTRASGWHPRRRRQRAADCSGSTAGPARSTVSHARATAASSAGSCSRSARGSPASSGRRLPQVESRR
jgi:NAD(P)-dependent dehydrogenase (short-subunit alcohol dehydrogenase family)